MKVLVTGAAGFIGSHLVDALAAGPDEIVGIDNLRRGDVSRLASHVGAKRVDFREIDIRDADAMREAMAGVDLVYHLAAQSNVLGAMSDPDYSFTANVTGTYNVLKAAAEAGARRVVFSSSREVYGEPESPAGIGRCCPEAQEPVRGEQGGGRSLLSRLGRCQWHRGTSFAFRQCLRHPRHRQGDPAMDGLGGEG